MKTCKKCNTGIEDNAKFCGTCGEEYIIQNENTPKSVEGIGGWLILVAIGVVISPLRLLAELSKTYLPIFIDGTWEALASPESEVYNSTLLTLMIGEIFFNSLIVLASIYLIYLFFAKKSFFPKLYILIIVVSLIITILDNVIVSSIFPEIQAFDDETIIILVRTTIIGIIWIPYMLISKRVKATFIH
jgi:hypothetical protein